MRTTYAIAFSVILTALVACGGRTSTTPDAPDAALRIAATIPPLEWIARGLAPEGAEVSVLLPPGASEHGYEPPPSRIAEFVRADVVLAVGMGLDPAAERALRASPKGGRAVVVFAEAAGVARAAAEAHAAHDHADPNHEDTHQRAEADPHLWLDPALMPAMVNATRDAIARQLARRGAGDDALASLDARRDAMLAEIGSVDAAYRERLAPFRGGAIVSAHDSMRRLADRYGLRVVGVIHAHEGAEPTPGEILRAAQGLRDATHRAILIEPQSGRAAADRLAKDTGAPVAMFDPLGSGDPGSGGWPGVMRANLDALVEALSQTRAGASR